MLTILLCDDNVNIVTAYTQQLLRIKEKYAIPMNIQTFTSGTQLLFYMDGGNETADIIYLDIVMGEENGITIAKQLREQGYASELLFLTANPEYVFDSFEAMPSNYIIKDTTSVERFEEIFLKTAMKAEKKSKDIFSCTNASTQKHIPFNEILYFEIENRKATVHYQDNAFSYYAKMEDIEQSLGQRSFVRTHRSYLVNILYIEEVKKDHLLLSNHTRIPIGITYAKQVKQKINQYFSYLM